MFSWLNGLRRVVRPARADIPDPLWHDTLAAFPFLARHGADSLPRLRNLTREFLDQKEFHGAAGLRISDDIAVAVAAQACLPVLHIHAPLAGLAWYSDFVGIVVYPGAVRAQREILDDAGVMHRYDEVLTGEAMQDGPVTLSWQDVAGAGQSAVQGYNVVIHEFAHKMDMRGGEPDGCPPLPAGFMGAPGMATARRQWLATLNTHYDAFCDKVSIAERFSGPQPWMDAYAAESVAEFFAVASEAYFVNPEYFARDFPEMLPMFDAFFNPPPG